MSIRTTVTLDEDVFERTKRLSQERGKPFRETLNELVRMGLLAEASKVGAKGFKIEPFHMGFRDNLNYDDIAGLIETVESENYR